MGTRRDALMALVAPGVATATPIAAAAAVAPPGGGALAAGLFSSLKTQMVPSDVQVVQTSGYVVAGLGGARYVASRTPGETPYRTQSADGRWFELAETEVTPQMFGAMGGVDGRQVDDTAAMQAWLDYLKLPLLAGANGVPKTVRGRLPTGTYLVTRSLDFTGDNDRIGGRTIVGDDLQNTGIQGELTEPFPVLDCTSAYNMHLEGFFIKCSKTSKASCCLLLAQDRDDTFITYRNSLQRIGLVMDYAAPNGVAALVVQNNDLLRILAAGAEGPIGLSIGWRLPVLRAGQARGGGSSTLVLDAQASGTDGAYVGLPVRLVAGAGAAGGGVDPIGKPAIGKIVAYNGASRTATVDRPWPAGAPDGATAFEVYAVGSKFKVPQSHDDATHYVLGDSCTIEGRTPIVITGVPGSVDLGDTYVAGKSGLDANHCAVLIAPCHPNDTRLGPFYLYGRNFRTENQSGATPFFAFKNACGQPVSVDVSGAPIVGTNNPANPSAVFADVGAAGFTDINIQGETLDNGALMFAVGGHVRSFRGSMHCTAPGFVNGGIDRFDFDWQQAYYDKNWLPFVLSTARHVADTGAGPVIPAGATVQVPGLPVGAWASQGYTLGGVYKASSYSGGGRAATVASWAIPAGALAFAAPVVRSLSAEIALKCAGQGVLGLYLRQANGSGPRIPLAQNVPMGPGQSGLVRLTVQSQRDGLHALGEVRLNKTILAELEGDFTGIDPTQPLSLEIDVAAATANPLKITAQLLRVD